MRAPRGAPLAMLAVLLSAWTGARALWWENPFAGDADAIAAQRGSGAAALQPPMLPQPALIASMTHSAGTVGDWLSSGSGTTALSMLPRSKRQGRIDAGPAAERPNAAAALLREVNWSMAAGSGGGTASATPAPFLPAPAAAAATGRWSLDAWAFWRQGSDAAPISQGRVPIYGASQVGAVLQYRLDPDAARDPRVYARAYRAVVRRGENELALGASARPLPRVPLRVAGEVRFTATAFGDEVRPSAFAITELPPVALPHGARLEVYGQAGWVGGAGATAFADGQASVTREVGPVASLTDNAVRLSVGAAAWGGAQRDAERIDVGPTLRLDFAVAQVPARVSLDWRERVGGQADPDSGLAVTLSTAF